jgi:type II secretory pathway component GspD/PulD (secretin)
MMRQQISYNTTACLRLSWFSIVTLGAALIMLSMGQSIHAQNPPQPSTSPKAGNVRINLRGDTPMVTLVEYVSDRLKIRFIYDESLSQKKINIQAPEELPVESLLNLLQSALQINGMALAQTENPVWYRIVPQNNMPQVSLPTPTNAEVDRLGPAVAITQVFTLKRGDPNQIKTLIGPFLSNGSGGAGGGANAIAVPANRTLIVTDISSNLRRIQRLIDILDAEQNTSSIRFIQAKHVSVDELSERLQSILAARARADGANPAANANDPNNSPAGNRSAPGIEIAVEPRTSQLILIGLPSQIDAALDLLKSLDVPLTTTTQNYRPQYLSPKQLDDIIRQWVDSVSPRPIYDSRIEGAQLVVSTTELAQQQIAKLIPQFDSRETSARQSPIRFYKIKNIPVQDILETLNSLQGGYVQNPFQSGRSNSNSQRSRTTNDRAVTGQNNPFVVGANSAQPGLVPPMPPASQRNGLLNPTGVNSFNGGGGVNPSASNNQNGLNPLSAYAQLAFQQGNSPYNGFQNNGGFFNPYGQPNTQAGAFERGIQSPLGNAQVTADMGSNTLIIIAEPEVQQAYQQLIEFLDKRRPQVMIEARIVIIDTSDDYTLGVEVSGGDRSSARKLFSFSSYGLSTVTPTTGALAITPGTGFNATLVDPQTADVVVRALATHRRARVLSSPKILVDDNAEGSLESVNEVPFTSVNASQTVATTSFAGFAKAGTAITVTPTISEGKHVNLDYNVTLNSFTGAGTAGVPPPRQTNEITSRVTVPDGYTIIVGGLTQKNVSTSFNGIPYLERIPIVRELSSLTANTSRDNSLFVFLRPIILEEDRFRDLKFLSKRASNLADEGHNFPASSPLLMSK